MARPDSRWMPLDWADYWKDTGHLSAAEHGAYLNLIGAYWVAGGPLVNNPEWLARLAKCTAKEWAKLSFTVLAFFEIQDGRISHKRVERELVRAATVYAKRKATMEKINAKRKQPTTTVHDQRDDDRTHSTSRTLSQPLPPHSPNGEKHPSDVLAKPTKRKAQIPHDWQPTPKDTAHAAAKKLDPGTIQNLVEPFRDHHIAKQTLSADFSANWRTWVANHINFYGTGPWPRVDGKRPTANVQGRASAATAFDQVRAEAGIHSGRGGDGPLRADGGSWAEGIDHGASGLGPIITTDYHERSAGPVGGIEGAHTTAGGANGERYDDADQSVSEAPSGLSSGRSEACADDPARPQSMVAGMAGIEGSLGNSHVPAPHDDGGAEADHLRRISA